MKQVLVTGGAGFIGSHLVQALIDRGDEVSIVDNFDPFYPERLKRRALHPQARLLESDIRDFQVPTRETLRHPAFAIAIAPFRVFQHLLTPMDQLRCLASVRAHLDPGGRLLFDVFNPHFAAMTRDRSAEVEDTPEFALGDGRYLRRASRVPRVHWAEQLSDVELIYYVRSGSDVERVVHAFPMRWYGAPELQHLLARSGYRVEGIYGDFDGGALRDDSPEIVVAAVRDD